MLVKYTYAYKTSDGMRHEAAMEAASREDVFALLRAKGIKAIKVVAADGSKANGEIRGVRKRVVALIAVCAAVLVGVVAFFLGESRGPAAEPTSGSLAAPRHQIYGDPVIVTVFERGNFELAFTNKADQMLAWFAQPGKLMCPRGIDPRKLAAEFAAIVDPRATHSLNEDDSREVRELKQIVNGMYEELNEYLANGNGTLRSYWRRLLQRTQQEVQIYERIRRELENEKSEAVWEEKNEALRRLGLLTIPSQDDSN